MYKKLSIVALICLSVLLTRCAGCKKQPAGKVPGSTYRQLQQRYGDSVARASTQFRSMTPKQQDFYKQGGRMHHLDTLLPSIRPGMLQDEVKLLLGEPSGTRTVGHKDYWNYMLFYSQALTLQFDEHRKLINLDGYGKAKWRNANFDHLVTQLKRGMMANDVNLILGPPDRVARSENGLTTTWFYEPQAGLATALEFEDEKLMSVTGHGQETWNRVNENDNQKKVRSGNIIVRRVNKRYYTRHSHEWGHIVR